MKPKQVLLRIETSRRFGRDIIQGISQFAKERADWMFDFEDQGLLEDLPRHLKAWSGDGVITRSFSDRLSQSIAALGCPAVELLGDGRTFPAEVVVDEQASAKMAVDHLVSQGFREVGFYSFAGSWWSEARRLGFERAVSFHKISGHIFEGSVAGTSKPYPTWRPIYHGNLVRWLDSLPKPIGIWAVADSQAVRIIEACRELNLRVPGDVGILGTGDEDFVCSLVTPSLSSVDLNAVQVGYQAAKLLDRKMRSTSIAKNNSKRTADWKAIQVQPSGVAERESTDRLAMIDVELHEAMKLIRQESARGLTVEQLAESMLLSRSTLERKFRKFFHCSPADEINRLRIEKAKSLLSDTVWPVHRVGREMGFESPENFVRYFKRIVGKTPLRYRNDLHR